MQVGKEAAAVLSPWFCCSSYAKPRPFIRMPESGLETTARVKQVGVSEACMMHLSVRYRHMRKGIFSFTHNNGYVITQSGVE